MKTVQLNGQRALVRTANARRKSAPPVETTVLPPAIMQLSRQSRFNPLRSLTPQSLSAALDAYDAGNLRPAALLWQAIANRDDTIAAVKPKRELSTAERSWTVLKTEDSPEAAAQAEVLTWFWNHVSAENAYDRNQRGGFARLVEQMMEARSYGFAAHHIVWQPGARLTARFEYVPLQFFENRTGRLRFIADGIGYDGAEMAEGEWMVTTSQPIMIAASIGYMFKRLSLNDWVAFSEKFGMPGVLGRTSASADSAAGIAMASAVESFGNEWVGVIYGDDGTGKIEIIKAEGGSASLPMPALIDRIDRKLATLYRGSDLSSMSSAQGQTTGASVQKEETDIFDRADARMIGETLNQVDRMVLAYTFGDAEPLAYVQLKVPDGKDLAFELSATEKLVGMGMEIGVESTREIFGIAAPKDGEDLLGAKRAPEKKPGEKAALVTCSACGHEFDWAGLPESAMGAVKCPQCQASVDQNGKAHSAANDRESADLARRRFLGEAKARLGKAYAESLQPVRIALANALDGDEAKLPARLVALRAGLPQMLATVTADPAVRDTLAAIFAASFFNGMRTNPTP